MTKQEYNIIQGIIDTLDYLKESVPATEHIITAQIEVLKDNLEEIDIQPGGDTMNLRQEYTKQTGEECEASDPDFFDEGYVEWLEAKYKERGFVYKITNETGKPVLLEIENDEPKISFYQEMTIIEDPRETEG